MTCVRLAALSNETERQGSLSSQVYDAPRVAERRPICHNLPMATLRNAESRYVEPYELAGWVVMVLATIVGCSSGDTVEEFVNEGSWCLRPSEGEDESVTATVITPGCYSGSCSEPMATQCSLTRDGATLTLTSLLRVKQLDHDACTADCRIYHASCSLSGLSDGQYDIVHGDTRTTVTLPLPGDGITSGEVSFFCPMPVAAQ